MTSRRENLEANRESFTHEKNKENFEATIDKARLKVAEEKEKKEDKREYREEERREKEENKK